MNKIFKFTVLFYLLINIFNISISNEKFFNEALELYENKKYEDARFMFERNIVFNPKDSISYLYLAKIYNREKNQEKEEKNLEATLLIEPNNEEAILMLMEIGIEKTNYSKVKELSERFKKIWDNPQKYRAPNFYRRFALGEINGTITASAQPENCGITHPFYDRRFTIREIARIQSFPDNFVFPFQSITNAYKVIGNAVPPILAWVLAMGIQDYLEKEGK